VSRKSKKRAKQAIPEEILAEGSGPNEAVPADAQTLADAAADALASADIAQPEAEVEAVAMAAEVAVVAAEAARAEAREAGTAKKGKKRKKPAPAAEPEVALDAWGQPIVIEPEADAEEPAAAESSDTPVEAAADEPADADSSESSDAPAEASADASLEADPDAASEPAIDDDAPAAEMAAAEADADADGVMPTSAATMDATQLKHLVEALVFAADKPVTIQRLRQLTRISDVRRLDAALAELAEDYKARGIALQVVSGGYQFRTNTTYSGWVQQLIAGRPVRLSRAQLETLAIVAYRQPITRPEIDEIRGVDSSSTLKVLLDRSLIRILGKREEAGRPTLYGTTKEFLDFFSLGDLRELPTLREYSELTAESRKVVSDRLGVSLDGAPAEAATPAEPVDPAAADTETPEPTMDDALRAYVESPGGDEPSPDASNDSDVVESLAGESGADEAAELSGDSYVDESAEPSGESVAGESAELSGESGADESAELSGDSHVEDSAELSGESHMGERAELASESADVTGGLDLDAVDESAEAHAGERMTELSADAQINDDFASGSASADDAPTPHAPHTFIDPEELAGRVVAGESDVHTSTPDVSSEREDEMHAEAPAAHAVHGEVEASESDGADASAHDDPAVG
jgi:segregation and condensation protein B